MSDLYGIDAEDPRMAASRDRLRRWAAEAGLDFDPPGRVPRTLRPLAASEWVRTHHPDSFKRLHEGLFRAYWGEGKNIEDPDVIGHCAEAAGVDPDSVLAVIDTEEARKAVVHSTSEARAIGVQGTPYFLLGGRILVAGAQGRETFDRAIAQLVDLND